MLSFNSIASVEHELLSRNESGQEHDIGENFKISIDRVMNLGHDIPSDHVIFI